MTLFLRSFKRIFYTSLVAMIVSCTQIGVSTKENINNGYFDKNLDLTTTKLRSEVESYLKERNLFERVDVQKNGTIVIHQNWVQSPSLRYYLLNFDLRSRHLSEWKAAWVIEQATTSKSKSKLRIAVLELLYLGDPNDKVKAPEEANGNWVETSLDKDRASALFEDFEHFRTSRKLAKPAIYLKTSQLNAPPKILNEIKKSKELGPAPWWTP